MSSLFDNENDSFLKKLRELITNSIQVDICVGYFNFSGWCLISDDIESILDRNGNVRLLIGINGESTEEEFYDKFCHEKINPINEAANLEKFAQLLELGLKNNKTTIKLSPDIHAKIYIFTDENSKNSVFIGSSNLTWSGLKKTKGELNCYLNDENICHEAKNWFEQKWHHSSKDITLELLKLIVDKIPMQYQAEQDLKREVLDYYGREIEGYYREDYR